MSERRGSLKPWELPASAVAQDGFVLLDGPGGVAVTMTPEAAERTADRLRRAAARARGTALVPGSDLEEG